MKHLQSIILLVCACCLLTLPILAQTELAPGSPISGELKASDKHTYQLRLAAKQTAHIVVTQQGVDAQVNVYDPAGKLMIEMDSPNGTQGVESVWLVKLAAGNYRVEVFPFTGEGQPARGGKYEIKLAELRAANAADDKLAQAQAAYLEGTRLGMKFDDEAAQKAAAAKLEEAARLLGSDSDPGLTDAVRRRISFVAPFLKIQRMKQLTKVSGTVTVWHSAGLGEAAKQNAVGLESLVNFYQPYTKSRPAFNFAVLNKSDWAELSGGVPFMMPWVTTAPPAVIVSDDLQTVTGMLAQFKNKVPAALNSELAAAGLSYETVTPLVVMAGGALNLGGYFREQLFGRLPRQWMNQVVQSYLIHAWLGEKHPQMAQNMRLGMRIPGAVLTPSGRSLDDVFSPSDMFTAGYGMSRAADLGAQLYDTHKLGLLAELQKAFPKGEKPDAATAEQRFFALSPHVRTWVESFGYTGAALEVQKAEEALVAARKGKDAAAFDRLVADDYCGLNQHGAQRAKAGFRMSAIGPNPVAVFTLDRTDIEISGDLAIVRGAQTEQWQGGPLEHHLFTRIWVKRDGRWQLLSNTQFMDPNKK
jgi:hypothetical protein